MSKLTNEEWNELSEEDKELRVEEKPEAIANPAPEGEAGVKQEEVDEQGVPLKNRLAEAHRKLEVTERKTQELEDKLRELSVSSATPEKKEVAFESLKERFVESGIDEDLVDDMITAFSSVAEKSNQQTKKELEQLKIGQAMESRKNILKDMQSSDDKGIIAKYRAEINKELDGYDPKIVGDPAVVDVAVARVIKRHLSELLDRKPVTSSSAVEGSPSSTPANGVSGELEKKAKSYAESNNIDIKRAREIVKKKEQALKSNE